MPSEAPWPEDAWGITLGASVTDIRSNEIYLKDRPDRVAELNRMGFIWDIYEEQWQRILDSMHAYKKLHGDLKVPYDFVVPSEAPWPEDAWGINLGTRLASIRNQENYVKGRPDRVAELNRMGFIWNIYEEQWQRILKSLHVYKKLHGDLKVPYDFAVPSEALWPEDAWGINLGKRVSAIRSNEIYVKDRPDRVVELNRMGFIWDVYEEQWQRILKSLQVYKELHGDLEVPILFAVPPEAPWPEDAWGINLGTRLAAIRNQEIYLKGRPDRVAELNRIGSIYNK